IGLRCYRQRRPCGRVGGGLHMRRHRRRNAADAGSAVGAPAPGANMCLPGSHRGRCSYKNETAVGARASGAKMCWPGSHRGRCSYRNETAVGAPAPGANMCWPGSHRGRCSYRNETAVGAPAPGAKMCLPGSHRGRCSYRSETVVGAPAPGANKCRPGANGVARVRYSQGELVLVPLRFLPGTPGHVPACEKMYNGGISRVARGCPVFPDFTSGDSMDTFIQMLRNISPEVYESLKTAVELGKWADGRKLTQEQKELCLQAIIAWEMDNLP